MEYGSIYIIKNKVNDKVYIGQTIREVEERFKQHMKPSNSKYHYKIYQAIFEIGKENFYYEILEECIPINELNNREIYWIAYYDSYKNGYNSNRGGTGEDSRKIEDIEYVINKINNGSTYEELANELNVSSATIYRALKKYNKTYREVHKIDKEKIIELYLDYYTYKELAEIVGVNERTISRTIKEFGITRKREKHLTEEQKETIAFLYQEGYSYSYISEETGIGKNKLSAFIKENNIQRLKKRKRSDYIDVSNIEKNIIEDYFNGMIIMEIKEKYGLSYGKVYSIIKDYKRKSNDYPNEE